jgi:hypothetical protein
MKYLGKLTAATKGSYILLVFSKETTYATKKSTSFSAYILNRKAKLLNIFKKFPRLYRTRI